ncbi:MAG: oxygen-independent coproporphyrinogen III oxidase-like protein, partial [Azonexus sp.]
MSRVIPIAPAPAAEVGNLEFRVSPPLALYIHVPWCVRKCPYCDFNSHELRGEIPEAAYLAALVADVEAALP